LEQGIRNGNEKIVTRYYYDTNPTKAGWVSDGFLFYVYSEKNDQPGLVPVYQYMTDDGRQLLDTSYGPDDQGWTIAFYAFAAPYPSSEVCVTRPVYQYGSNVVLYTTNAFVAQPAIPNGLRKNPEVVFHAFTPNYAIDAASRTNILAAFPLIGQETDLWCWAACTEMVMEYYHTFIDQAGEANTRFGRNDCDSNQESKFDKEKCRKVGWFQMANHGMSYNLTPLGTALSWDQLKAEIDSTRPVPFTWYWTSGGGHAMVATGYLELGENKMVWISDPWPVDKGDHKWVTYSHFVSQARNHTHGNDLSNVQYKSK
jgi:hypothetical protein